jgi:Ni/Fe-hydrogenase subunit HybB-like protein
MSVEVAGRTVSADPRVALRAVRLEIAATPRSLKLWFALLTALCLVGAVGAVIALPPGWEVLGTTPTVEWGILITGYVFFAITTSGLCLASSLGTVFGIEMFIPLEKRHAILALLSLVTAFGLIALDLHYPVRMVFGAVLSPSPFSPMWWMGVFYGAYLVFLVTEVWSMFTGHWQIHRVACVLSSITAILAPTTLGAVFGVLAARPYWHGAFTPPAMVTTALLSGIALLGIVFSLVHRYKLAGWHRATTLAIPAIRLLLMIVLPVTVLVVGWQMMFGLYGVVPGLATATAAILVGPLALQFWVFRVFLGLVVPLVLVLWPRTKTPAGLFAASCLVFVGIVADRMVFVSAGQIAPGTAVSGVVSSPWAEYTPSPVEISIIVGAFAFFALVYTLAERYLPMGEHEGHLVGAFLGSTDHPGGTREDETDPADPAGPAEPAEPAAPPELVASAELVARAEPAAPPELVASADPVPPAAPILDPAGGAP